MAKLCSKPTKNRKKRLNFDKFEFAVARGAREPQQSCRLLHIAVSLFHGGFDAVLLKLFEIQFSAGRVPSSTGGMLDFFNKNLVLAAVFSIVHDVISGLHHRADF